MGGQPICSPHQQHQNTSNNTSSHPPAGRVRRTCCHRHCCCAGLAGPPTSRRCATSRRARYPRHTSLLSWFVFWTQCCVDVVVGNVCALSHIPEPHLRLPLKVLSDITKRRAAFDRRLRRAHYRRRRRRRRKEMREIRSILVGRVQRGELTVVNLPEPGQRRRQLSIEIAKHRKRRAAFHLRLWRARCRQRREEMHELDDCCWDDLGVPDQPPAQPPDLQPPDLRPPDSCRCGEHPQGPVACVPCDEHGPFMQWWDDCSLSLKGDGPSRSPTCHPGVHILRL